MTMSIESPKSRRQLQRAFFRWLAANRHRLLVPVSVAKRNDSQIDLRLHGMHSSIQAHIYESKTTKWSRSMIRGRHVRQYVNDFPTGSHKHAFEEISISVDYTGTFWDFLYCIEVMEIHQTDGYTCGLCDPDYRILYASRTELWEGELFEPFLKWINETLHPANWLVLRQIRGCTWAELADTIPAEKPSTDEPVVTHCLPTRL